MSIVETLKKDIARKELELQQLRQALEIIKKIERDEIDYTDPAVDQTEPEPDIKVLPPSVPAKAAAPTPPYSPPRFAMMCSACGDEMYRAYKRVPSGITVEYWQCTDSGCNNEMY